MFRPLIGHLQALRRTDTRIIYISMHCVIPNAYTLRYRNVKQRFVYIRVCVTFLALKRLRISEMVTYQS